jgi:hypothetical protein
MQFSYTWALRVRETASFLFFFSFFSLLHLGVACERNGLLGVNMTLTIVYGFFSFLLFFFFLLHLGVACAY